MRLPAFLRRRHEPVDDQPTAVLELPHVARHRQPKPAAAAAAAAVTPHLLSTREQHRAAVTYRACVIPPVVERERQAVLAEVVRHQLDDGPTRAMHRAALVRPYVQQARHA